MKKCDICNHSMTKHKKLGSGYILCREYIGSDKLGNYMCSCNNSCLRNPYITRKLKECKI